ncbi:HPr-rel-A system PqqD family peptide chaperone [Thiobacillus sedimenti]|uniref:HPr-rel-A system PqqD family peptide chaperone n=1 Tax=Thiobacillus sedimenti TaxID=3110231 RepID=A0ABZ1CHV6_9PROT|nr:HPr-rel-A system PqqD family peptide chaperone [Thiobacillus sp. SCUT-2]WRS38971.1 HPr-rel-A system PqqD family peptide chaperone [Thiobacillus sp. SCUT-2]
MTLPPLSPSRLLKVWGDEAVVYDTESGDTHYLNPLTLALYRICGERASCRATDLGAALAAHFEVEETPQLEERAVEAFDSLCRIGLLAAA